MSVFDYKSRSLRAIKLSVACIPNCKQQFEQSNGLPNAVLTSFKNIALDGVFLFLLKFAVSRHVIYRLKCAFRTRQM